MGKLKVEEMPLFAKRTRGKRRTEWVYRCGQCGNRLVAGIEIRGWCGCGGTFKEVRGEQR